MRAVIQRVTHASVTIEGCVKSQIGQGFLVLLGVCDEDTMEDVEWLVKKIANLRVFGDENDVMNRSILDVDGEALVVSQFTLFASYKKGNRPSWFRAGSHEHSIPLYEAFCAQLSEAIGKPVGTGEFGADMKVELLNDGPVTICMDTKNKVVFLILSPITPIWGLLKWKKNSRLLNYEWIAALVIIIITWIILLFFIGPEIFI